MVTASSGDIARRGFSFWGLAFFIFFWDFPLFVGTADAVVTGGCSAIGGESLVLRGGRGEVVVVSTLKEFVMWFVISESRIDILEMLLLLLLLLLLLPTA